METVHVTDFTTIGAPSYVRLWSILKDIDAVLVASPISPQGLFNSLDLCSETITQTFGVHVPTFHDLSNMFQEETCSVIPNDIICIIMQWLSLKLSNSEGRKECREQILNFFLGSKASDKVSHSAPFVSPLPSSPALPINPPCGPAWAPRAMQPNFVFKNDNDISESDEKDHEIAFKRAEQIVKGLDRFDGLVDNYLKWRHSVVTCVCNSYVRSSSWTHYYCILSLLSGNALNHVRRSVSIGNCGPEEVIRNLYQVLDQKYLTQTAISVFEREYGSLRQRDHETVEAYAARFISSTEIRNSIYSCSPSDLELRTRFANGIVNPNLLWLKSFAETVCHDFDSYSRTIIAYSKNIAPSAPPFQLAAAGIGRSRHGDRAGNSSSGKCFRCNEVGHFADSCIAESVFNLSKRCQKCGSVYHNSDQCKPPKLLQCKRCKRSGHISSVCKSRVVAPLAATNPSPSQANSDDALTSDLHVQNNTLTISALSSSVIAHGLSDIVDTNPIMDELKVFNGRKSCLIPGCLKDTGASASFIHQDLAKFCVENGLAQSVSDTCLRVEYANGAKEQISKYITLSGTLSSSNQPMDIHFLVLSTCSPRLILGRPVLKKLGPVWCHDPAARSIAPTTEVSLNSLPVEVAMKQQNVQVIPWVEFRRDGPYARCPLIENACVLPYREKQRSMSIVDRRICYTRLVRMAAENKVSKVDPVTCHVVLAPVLVDKLSASKPRVFTDMDDEEIHLRYRITLDCRPLNELCLVRQGDTYVFTLPNADEKRTSANQSQLCGRTVLESLPFIGNAHARYAKVDLSDAFSSIKIPPSIGRLLSVIVPDLAGTPVAFRWQCLPQGWRHSPFLFTTCINAILRMIDTDLQSINITARHFQDDIILFGDSEESVNSGMKITISKLKDMGFRIQDKKCIWCCDSITFCGYLISKGTLKPHPKTPLTSKLISEGWKIFEENPNAEFRIRWLREWAGRFQFWRDFFSQKHGNAYLSLFYDLLQVKNAEISGHQLTSLKSAFFELAELCLNCLPLAVGISPSIRSVLVVDANADAWGGILIKAIANEDGKFDDMLYSLKKAKGMEELASAVSDLRGALVTLGISSPFVLVPVKLCGATFSPRQRRSSSTHRERLAQLECFSQCQSLIDSPLVVVCDNMNCSLTWHNLDLFGARHLDMWERMQACLSDPGHIWLPRNSIPSYPDSIARTVATPETSSSATCNAVSVDNGFVTESENDPSSSIVISSDALRRDLIRGYRADKTSKYHGHKIFEIFHTLSSDSHVDMKNPLTRLSLHRFKLNDGLLYYKSISGDRCVVPNSASSQFLGFECNMRAALLSIYHDKLLHPGVRRLESNLGRNWFWSGLSSDCAKYCQSCEACRTAKTAPARSSGEGQLGSLVSKAKFPWEHLMMDFAICEDVQDVLLVIDCYSHWLFCFPVKNQTAETTAECLKNLFLRIGFPSKIICDNGPHFVNDVISRLASYFGFSIFTGSSYNPSRQGLVERAVKEIKVTLAKSLGSASSTPIADRIQLATMLHNMSPLSYGPYSPYSILYGREPRFASTPDFCPTEHHDLQDLREAWDRCRVEHHAAVNDHNMLSKSGCPLAEGMRVIWRTGEGNTFTKVLQKKIGVNHWLLTDGRSVPESQLEAFPEIDDSDIRIPSNPSCQYKEGDLLLFSRDEAMDLGIMISFVPLRNSVMVRNLYMNSESQWFDHGDYFDEIPMHRIVKKVRLNKSNRIDRRFLN